MKENQEQGIHLIIFILIAGLAGSGISYWSLFSNTKIFLVFLPFIHIWTAAAAMLLFAFYIKAKIKNLKKK